MRVKTDIHLKLFIALVEVKIRTYASNSKGLHNTLIGTAPKLFHILRRMRVKTDIHLKLFIALVEVKIRTYASNSKGLHNTLIGAAQIRISSAHALIKANSAAGIKTVSKLLLAS